MTPADYSESFLSVNEQIRFFLYAVVMGVCFGPVYDALRAVRIVFPHPKALVFLEDILYTAFCGFCFFVFSTQFLWGELRAFVLVGALLGFLVYIFTAGRIVVWIFETAVRGIKRLCGKVKRACAAFRARCLVKIVKKDRLNRRQKAEDIGKNNKISKSP